MLFITAVFRIIPRGGACLNCCELWAPTLKLVYNGVITAELG